MHRVAELREQTADERAGCHAARRAEERQSRGEFRTFAQEVAQARRCGAGGERDGRAVQSAAEHERAERLRRDERRCPEQGDHHGDGHDGPSSVVIGPVTEDRWPDDERHDVRDEGQRYVARRQPEARGEQREQWRDEVRADEQDEDRGRRERDAHAGRSVPARVGAGSPPRRRGRSGRVDLRHWCPSLRVGEGGTPASGSPSRAGELAKDGRFLSTWSKRVAWLTWASHQARWRPRTPSSIRKRAFVTASAPGFVTMSSERNSAVIASGVMRVVT